MPGAAELRAVRRRIRSVSSIRKITRAMELIAASRINRARQAVEATRPYAEMITEVIHDVSGASEVTDHPLLRPHEEIRRVAVLVCTSDRGLAGAYNTNVLRRAERLVKQEREAGREIALYALGRKADSYFRYRGLPPEQTWTGISERPSYANAREIGRTVMEAYRDGDLDRVWLAYTDFKSAVSQVSQVAQVLPVDPAHFGERDDSDGPSPMLEFEPGPDDILDELIPRYVEQRVFAGLLESAASEHANRQRAMKSATDNAGDIIEDLTREANRARQAAITTEISEIVGGAEALSSHS